MCGGRREGVSVLLCTYIHVPVGYGSDTLTEAGYFEACTCSHLSFKKNCGALSKLVSKLS